MILMNWISAMRKLPKAIEPKWYRSIHFIPAQREPFPAVSLLKEKYQMEQAAAMMN